jgi:hypothetical protein
MPTPLTLAKPDFSKLNIKGADLVKWALLIEKTPGNPAQTIDSATFRTSWGIDDDTLSKALAALERGKLIKTTVAPFSVIWNTPVPTTGMTVAEVQEKRTMGILDDYTSYVFYALLLTKGATNTQTVDPAFYAATPWSIPQANLITAVNELVGKDTPVFSVNYPSIGVTWLEAIGNAA